MLNVVNGMDGWLSCFCEILITTSPAKFGKKFEKNVIKFSSLKVCVTLCDDLQNHRNNVNAFVHIELCHMENAFMATIFNTIF